MTNGIANDVPAATPPILSLRNVSVTFGGVKALQEVSFEVLPGEVQCIAGENGSGKSTLIKVITGVYRPEPGSNFSVGGKTVEAMTPGQARAAGFQVIWQDLSLFNEMTVAENIAIEAVLGAVPKLVDHAAMRRTATAVLERLGTQLDVDARLGGFGVAQRQIVAIARALVREARVIFMDEPTSSLTRQETLLLLDIVRTLSKSGIAVVFVSHRLAEVLEISTRVTVLRDGRLVGVYPTKDMTQTRLAELMTGKTLNQAVTARDVGDAAPVLRVSGLTRHGEYKDVSFTIHKGETLGLTGLLGAGRTELALSIFGMTRPASGEIAIDGAPVRLRSNRDAIRAGVGYVSEDRLSLGLIQQQSIADNLVVTVLGKILEAGLISPRRKQGLVAKWIGDLAIKVGAPEDPDHDPLRRQSAARRDRQVACDRTEAAHPRLPDRRGGRRRPRRHFRDREAARRGRPRHPADLRRGAGGIFQLGPRPAHEVGQHRRRVRSKAREPRRGRKGRLCVA